MNKEKFLATLKGIVDLASDYQTCKSLPVKFAIEEMIIGRAKMLIDDFRKAEKPVEKKSEVPCNCCEEKSLQEKIIKAVTDSVKKTLPPDVQVTVFTAN